MTLPLGWAPVRGVIFDFHSTLGHGGDPADWLEGAWTALGRPGSPQSATTKTRYAALLDFLDRIWEHAARVDPHGERDLDPTRHRAVFDATVGPRTDLGLDAELGNALYRTMLDRWAAYPDAVPTLRDLRAHGIRTAILSNMGVNLHPVLAREGLAAHLDGVVLSWECGVVKPAPEAFAAALAVLDLPPETVLMVGDNAIDDAGAAAMGIRTLLLPRSAGVGARGLGIVARLV